MTLLDKKKGSGGAADVAALLSSSRVLVLADQDRSVRCRSISRPNSRSRSVAASSASWPELPEELVAA